MFNVFTCQICPLHSCLSTYFFHFAFGCVFSVTFPVFLKVRASVVLLVYAVLSVSFLCILLYILCVVSSLTFLLLLLVVLAVFGQVRIACIYKYASTSVIPGCFSSLCNTAGFAAVLLHIRRLRVASCHTGTETL